MNGHRCRIPALLLLACATMSSIATAQNTPPLDPTLDETLDAFFAELLKNNAADTAKAFNDILLVDSPQILRQRQAVEGLISRASKLSDKYGRALEFERIAVKPIGDRKDLVLVKYLYKCEHFPVVWYFTYYRAPVPTMADRRWRVVAVRFDTDLELLGL